MLAMDNCIQPEYPSHLAHINPRRFNVESSAPLHGKSNKSSKAKKRIRKEAVRNVLNDMLGRSGLKGDCVSGEDVNSFISEIATNDPDKGINFDDFIHIFR